MAINTTYNTWLSKLTFPQKSGNREKAYNTFSEEKMTRIKRIYSSEFKQEAVTLWQTTEKTATVIEQELGITSGLLNKAIPSAADV